MSIYLKLMRKLIKASSQPVKEQYITSQVKPTFQL